MESPLAPPTSNATAMLLTGPAEAKQLHINETLLSHQLSVTDTVQVE